MNKRTDDCIFHLKYFMALTVVFIALGIFMKYENSKLKQHNENLQDMNDVQAEYIKQYQEFLLKGNVQFVPELEG